jgi:hypothetical protein
MSYEAGIWQQGEGLVVWSRHRTAARAARVAREYARRAWADGPSTGGALSWSGGYRDAATGRVVWVDRTGETQCIWSG